MTNREFQITFSEHDYIAVQRFLTSHEAAAARQAQAFARSGDVDAAADKRDEARRWGDYSHKARQDYNQVIGLK